MGFYVIITGMFIQLTRTDGAPVWLNSSFIVTVEPARGGGSIVVPIGDGLDYEVRERPDVVLGMLEGVPPVKVVPVPPPKALAPAPEDVSPEGDMRDCDRVTETAGAPQQPKKTRKTKSPAKKKTVETDPEPEKADVVAPAPKRKRASSKKTSVEAPAEPPLPEDFRKIADDLRSRKCRTVKRMRNAMMSSYAKMGSDEADRIIEAMMNEGYIVVEADGHVNWTGQAV